MRPQDAIKIIQDGVQDIERQIAKKKPSTAKYMDYEPTKTGARILVTDWFAVFEHGRGPRKSNTPSGPQSPAPFTTAFEYRLYRWAKASGILRGTPKQQEQQVKAMRYKINKEGSELYKKTNRGKNPIDIYHTIIKKETEKITNDVAMYGVTAISDIMKTLK